MPQARVNDLPASPSPNEPAPPGSVTYWDQINVARWGAYLIDREQMVVQRAATLAGQPGAAIDLGCGSGHWSALLAQSGWQLTSIDVDTHSLAVCKRNVPSANCVQVDPSATAIPCGPGSASLLVCIEVAPAIQAPWFLSECHRVLANNGLVVAVWWNRRSWRWFGWRLKRFLTGKKDGHSFYKKSYSAWRKDLRTAGFDVIDEEGFSWAPFGRASNSPLIPLFAKLERLFGLHKLVTLSPWVLFIAKKTKA